MTDESVGIRRANVWRLLKDGLWHSTMEVNAVHIGGSEGCRRLRELRRECRRGKRPGWTDIECRKVLGKTTQWEYRVSNNVEKTVHVGSGVFALAQEDAVDWLRGQPDASVDLIITDPAYESLEKHRAKGTTTRLKHSKASSNDWFKIFPNSRFEALLIEMYRVLKPDTHCYIFCDQETGFFLHNMIARAGVKLFKFKKALIWDKKKIGMGYSYRARHEWILYLEKGKRALNDKGVPDVLACERIHNGYPTEKPVALIEILVRQSSQAGDLVVDPFMGSGSTGVAAMTTARHFAGTDTCAEAVEISRQRLLEAGGQELVDAKGLKVEE